MGVHYSMSTRGKENTIPPEVEGNIASEIIGFGENKSFMLKILHLIFETMHAKQFVGKLPEHYLYYEKQKGPKIEIDTISGLVFVDHIVSQNICLPFTDQEMKTIIKNVKTVNEQRKKDYEENKKKTYYNWNSKNLKILKILKQILKIPKQKNLMLGKI